MEKWQCTSVLQNEIREHEAHEKKIIEAARKILKAISQYEYELTPINSINDILKVFIRIDEEDTFKNITGANTMTGEGMRTVNKEIEKWIDTTHKLKSKWDYEESVLRDNQGKEDKVVFYLNSIDQSVQSIKEMQNIEHEIPNTGLQNPKGAAVGQIINRNCVVPQIINNLHDAKQCENTPGEDNKFRCYSLPQTFINWLYDNGYQDLTAECIFDTFSFKNEISLNTIKDYFSRRRIKKTKKNSV
jgi:hypothetical protein